MKDNFSDNSCMLHSETTYVSHIDRGTYSYRLTLMFPC